MTVHIFGAADSPCTANSMLKRTADNNVKDFDAVTVDTLRRNFDVDDRLKSVPTPDAAIQLASQLVELCSRGGFNLTKLTKIPVGKRATPSLDLMEH